MSEVKITTSKDGSLVVTGPIVLRDHEGNEFDVSERPSVYLCRCGHSANKPFCDGSHRKVGFIADALAPSSGSEVGTS